MRKVECECGRSPGVVQFPPRSCMSCQRRPCSDCYRVGVALRSMQRLAEFRRSPIRPIHTGVTMLQTPDPRRAASTQLRAWRQVESTVQPHRCHRARRPILDQISSKPEISPPKLCTAPEFQTIGLPAAHELAEGKSISRCAMPGISLLSDMCVTFVPGLCVHGCQTLQDAAVVHRFLALAFLTQVTQVLLEL